MLNRSEKDAILFHLAFGAVALVVIALPAGLLGQKIAPSYSLGLRIWALLVGYHAALVWISFRRLHQNWLLTMRLLVPLGMFLIIPDGFLVAGLKTLVYTDMGVGKIFHVSSFMGLMWPIPLFVCTLVGRGLEARGYGYFQAAAGAGLSGLCIFYGAEEILTRIPIWYAVEGSCTFLGHSNVAIYVLFPEFLLSMVTFMACRYSLWQYHQSSQLVPMYITICGAFLIMTIYLGNLVVSFVMIDGDKM